MNPNLLTPEAVEEMSEAVAWYEERREGLGQEFLEELRQVMTWVIHRPASFPRLRDVPHDLDIRRALLPRFPFAVVFLRAEQTIRVLAIAHQKRRPNYWLNRVQP